MDIREPQDRHADAEGQLQPGRKPWVPERRVVQSLGKWWSINRDCGATDPVGPFDTKEEADT